MHNVTNPPCFPFGFCFTTGKFPFLFVAVVNVRAQKNKRPSINWSQHLYSVHLTNLRQVAVLAHQRCLNKNAVMGIYSGERRREGKKKLGKGRISINKKKMINKKLCIPLKLDIKSTFPHHFLPHFLHGKFAFETGWARTPTTAEQDTNTRHENPKNAVLLWRNNKSTKNGIFVGYAIIAVPSGRHWRWQRRQYVAMLYTTIFLYLCFLDARLKRGGGI